MPGILGRLLPWVVVFAIWFSLNRTLDKVDTQKAHAAANKFWKRLYFAWGWIFGTRSWLTYVRYIVTGILLFLLLRWLAVSISTPVT